MIKKLLLIAILGLFLVSMASSEESGGKLIGKQNNVITLPQECASCSYVTITSIQYPDMSRTYLNSLMTKQGSSFNYSFNDTSQLGNYVYCVVGDVDGTDTVACKDFEITPNGFINSIGFYILIFALSLGIIILGLALKDAPITILGSFGLYFLGLYILFYGLVGMKDNIYTWSSGIIVLALAFYISVKSAMELIDDTY